MKTAELKSLVRNSVFLVKNLLIRYEFKKNFEDGIWINLTELLVRLVLINRS